MTCVHRFLTIALFLLLPFANAVQGEEIKPLSQEQLEAIAIQPASNWGKTGDNTVPEMLPLFKEEAIQFNGETRKYRLHTPDNMEPGKKYPLILWLHGTGESGTDNKMQLVHLHHIITSLTGEKKRDFFLLVPQCNNMEYWGRDRNDGTYRSAVAVPPEVENGDKTLEQFKKELREQTQAASEPGAKVTLTEQKGGTMTSTRTVNGVTSTTTKQMIYLMVTVEPPRGKNQGGSLEMSFAMIDQAIEKYPVDTNRITVSGLSSGGDGTWDALEKRPDLFAAAVPLVSWNALTDESIAESPILKKIPIWAIYSSDDSGIDSARTDFERVEKAGCNVKKTEFGICGHSAWTPAMLQADIFNWLLSRAKDGDEFVQVFDPGIDPDDMKGIVDVATRDPGKPALAPAVEKSEDFIMGAVPNTGRLVRTPAERLQVPKPMPEPVGKASTKPTISAKLQTPPKAIEVHVQHSDGRVETRIVPVHPDTPVMPYGRIEIPSLPPGMPVPAMPMPFSPERDEAYASIARVYYILLVKGGVVPHSPKYAAEISEKFTKCARKISPQRRTRLIMELTNVPSSSHEGVWMLEELLDEIAMPQMPPGQPMGMDSMMPRQLVGMHVSQLMPMQPEEEPANAEAPTEETEDATPTISAQRIIEECDRPWAMTSESLYGMFPADWGKEAEAVPEFLVNSTSDELAKKLAVSIGKDDEAKDFVAACRSILSLQNKPMSSPWFETDGGRLRSDIQYSLSAKGEMFVRFLKTVKDSGGNSAKATELAKVAEKTLEKIELVLAKE